MRSKTVSFIVVLIITALAWLNYYEHAKLTAARKQVQTLSQRVHRLEVLLQEARLPVVPDNRAPGNGDRLMQGREYQAAVEAFERQLKDLQDAQKRRESVPPQERIQPEPESAPAGEPVTQHSLERTSSSPVSGMVDQAILDALNLPVEQQGRLETLIQERQAACNEFLAQLANPDITSGQRAEITEQSRQAVGALDDGVAQLLGGELYPFYEEMEAGRLARMEHASAMAAMEDAGIRPDEETEGDLLDLMLREIAPYPSLAPLRSAKGFAWILAAPRAAGERTRDMDAFHKAVVENADGLLTPAQIAVLESQLSLSAPAAPDEE